jgi:hypothetical protein
LFANFERQIDFHNNQSGKYNYSTRVLDRFNRKSLDNISFTIASKIELKYAVKLFKIYKTVVGPYLEANKEPFEFDRFFAIIGEMNNFVLGKTVHSTEVTFDLSLRFYEWVTAAE